MSINAGAQLMTTTNLLLTVTRIFYTLKSIDFLFAHDALSNNLIHMEPLLLSPSKITATLFFFLFILFVFYLSIIKKNNSDGGILFYTFNIVNKYPHDRTAFTQGLVYDNGYMYEGTGRYGHSTLRKVDLKTGKIMQLITLPDNYFGEGITLYNNTIIQLTYRSHTGFVYDKTNFDLLKTFQYSKEGWGLTNNGTHLIMSDGTASLYFLDPETFQEVYQVVVHDGKRQIQNLNELEYIKGEVYANIWKSNRIARIDPKSGNIVGWIDLKGLLNPSDKKEPVDVLNGIAYDKINDRLFVTGKYWPWLFEIELNQQ